MPIPAPTARMRDCGIKRMSHWRMPSNDKKTKIHLSEMFKHRMGQLWKNMHHIPFHENSCEGFAISDDTSPMESDNGISKLS